MERNCLDSTLTSERRPSVNLSTIRRRQRDHSNQFSTRTEASSVDHPRASPEAENALITFSCFHFAIVSNEMSLSRRLDEISEWQNSFADLGTKPTSKHVHIPVYCHRQGCQSMSRMDLMERILQIAEITGKVLDNVLAKYYTSGDEYHRLPLHIRAMLSEQPECALAHRQFGGIETLTWISDPFFAPYIRAQKRLDKVRTSVRGSQPSTESVAQALAAINDARMDIGRILSSLFELLDGVRFLSTCGLENAHHIDSASSESLTKATIFATAIRVGWERRVQMS